MSNWVWLGDHLAVDFANTVKTSADGARVELIQTPADFATWREAEPVEVPGLDDVDDRTLTRIRAVRDAVLLLLQAAAVGENLPRGAVEQVNDVVRHAAATRILGGCVGQTVAHPLTGTDVDRGLGVLAAAAVDLLGRDDLANLAVCHAPGCGQLFHRARPNQRWCSPGCGNRARVDRHRHRSSM